MPGKLATLILALIFILDVTTDVATGVELILNDHFIWGKEFKFVSVLVRFC